MNATPVSKEVNREEIRMLVADIGYQETQQRTGIPANTLYQWARRFGWNQPIVHSQTVRTVRQAPADAHSAILAERKAQSRSLLSEYQIKAATEAAAHEKPLSITRQVSDLASIHAKVWPEDQTNSNAFTLNVLNMGSLDVDIETPNGSE
jgi:hypothetical protein